MNVELNCPELSSRGLVPAERHRGRALWAVLDRWKVLVGATHLASAPATTAYFGSDTESHEAPLGPNLFMRWFALLIVLTVISAKSAGELLTTVFGYRISVR
ncbi:unnamed protein product [Heligmosomoides polygyrus]|uniref:ABC transporter permease n=1 Tax=Heligmosomoides polygyrus TaxID=6339 RepID=A0A183FFS4_HELPZ|nr:unnamed protein product [Heligmosomoides polygyrus]